MDRRVKRLVFSAAAVAVVLSACGGGGDGRGGSRALGDDGIRSAEVVAQTNPNQQPVDAAPSPDGRVIYYLATGAPAATVFSVPGDGGTVSTITSGAPLAEPSGIGVATDASRLFVADPQSGATGAILSLATSTGAGAPTVLPGTQGRAPRGVDIVGGTGGDTVYFTGVNPATRAPGLYRVPAAGGTVATVAEGAPFVSPDSVVVAADGTAYVSDQGSGRGHGLVFRVAGSTVTPVLTDIELGAPGGVTLLDGDATLLVSSIDPASRSDQVLFLELATGKTAAATKVIGANKASAGGLHRAHDAPVLAWADVQRPGRVYRVEP